jgi:hypothetical protein
VPYPRVGIMETFVRRADLMKPEFEAKAFVDAPESPRSGDGVLREARRLRPVRLRLCALLASTPLCMFVVNTAPCQAQQAASLSVSTSNLPDAPQPQPLPETGSASISGDVLDSSGAVVPSAKVTLTSTAGLKLRTATSGADGVFTFTKLPAGTYLVVVEAPGFGPYTSSGITVSANQTYALPDISLQVGGATTSVVVRPAEVIAQEQIKQEERQRVLGIIPNFYISYTYDAAPMTTKQKYQLAAHDTFDWTGFISAGVAAGIQQANNSFKGYGQGAAGYGKRYAAAYGDGLFTDLFSHAVYPSLFHQDPRYYYQGSGSIKSRVLHAASFAIITRNDRGQSVPNYSYLAGAMTAGAISNLYYPHADRGANLVFTNAAIGIAGRAGGTILREFLLKRITTNVPANGKP